MKMAKASERDMKMAMRLCTVLESLERGYMPPDARLPDGADNEDFYSENAEDCYRAMKEVLGIVRSGSIGRVIWGMAVLLDPANKVVDPDADTLEDHPDTVAANKDAKRYHWLRSRDLDAIVEGGVFAGMIPENVVLNSEDLDREIDAAMLKTPNAKFTGQL